MQRACREGAARGRPEPLMLVTKAAATRNAAALGFEYVFDT